MRMKPLSNIVKEFKPELIHIHGHHYPITWLSALIAKSRNIPTLLTVHGMYALTDKATLLEEVFNYTLFKYVLHVVNAVIALTPIMASYIRRYRSNLQCYIVPNGVNLEIYRMNINNKPKYREKYGLDEDRIIVLYRGRFAYVKGFLELIYAIKILNRSERIRKNVLFLLIGDGPLRNIAVRELNQYNNCMIMNWTPREDIHELYIASDIFILPSKWHEAFSLAALEAMAANLYIVASKRGGLPSVLEGYMRKKYLETPSVGEIVKVLNDTIASWDAYKSVDVDNYVERFKWSNIVARIEEIYRESLKNYT
jgi:glycosyltransferase involved in cell wall biosynthesis